MTFFCGFGFSYFFCFLPVYRKIEVAPHHDVGGMQSHLLISSKGHQNEYPKTSFSNFLKEGENKESDVFTIQYSNALKKRSQLLLTSRSSALIFAVVKNPCWTPFPLDQHNISWLLKLL